MNYRNTSPYECPRCLVSGGKPCIYTGMVGGIHREPRSREDGTMRLMYVENVPGQPMQKMHRERPRIRCVPLGESWVADRPVTGGLAGGRS